MASIEGLPVTIGEMERFVRMARYESDKRVVKFALTQIQAIARSIADVDVPEMLLNLRLNTEL